MFGHCLLLRLGRHPRHYHPISLVLSDSKYRRKIDEALLGRISLFMYSLGEVGEGGGHQGGRGPGFLDSRMPQYENEPISRLGTHTMEIDDG